MAINRIKTGGITDGTIQSGDLAPGTIANDRLANTSITINGTAIALGASGEIVAGTDWKAVTVADGSTTVNTVAGGGYLLDTNAGVIEAFLPTSPSRGDTVVIADYSGTFATNRVIVNTGGANIDSTATGDVQLTTNNTITEFVYIDAAKGWLVKSNQAAGTTPSSALTLGNIYDEDTEFISATGGTITTSGDYKIHTFTGDGCFVVSAGLGALATVDYLVVAGGAGGGGCMGSGGGAGGYRESHSTPVSGCYTASPLATPTGLQLTVQTYPVTVGGGGAGGGSGTIGTNGSNSVFSTITSAGGGGGGVTGPSAPPAPPGAGDAQAGGSGGGQRGAYFPNAYGPPGAAGNTPPTSPPQGNPGGRSYDGQSTITSGGGGGGSGAAGEDALAAGGPSGAGGNGGAGATTSISGSPTAYAGGGGAGTDGPGATDGSGGTGGGGGGNSPTGTAGTSNTGGGGGGGSAPANGGGAGGKGIVIIRYKFQ